MDDATWAALTVALTVLFGIGTWLAYRRRGLASGLKGAGITLIPGAAYFTDTLKMFTRIVSAVSDWGTGLVFRPTVWLGVILVVAAALLYVTGRTIASRSASRAPRPKRSEKGRSLESGNQPEGRAPAASDEDEIEALLRNRGIT